jgi:hypothetical protein
MFKLPVRAVLAAALLTLTLAGPASAFPAPNSPEKAKLPAPAGSGVVIVSAGAPRKCVAKVSELAIAPLDAPMLKQVKAGLVVDNYAVKSDYADHMGTLNVLVLPAGDYQVYGGVVNPYQKVSKATRGVFSVKAGETVYLGELFMTQGCGYTPITFETRDQEARDLAQLRRRRADFVSVEIVKRLITYDGKLVPTPEKK